jgi:hypothetical protein
MTDTLSLAARGEREDWTGGETVVTLVLAGQEGRG